MARTRDDLHRQLDRAGGVLFSRRHPRHRRTIERMAADGELTAVLPGVYVRGAPPLSVRALAVCGHFPDAVVTGPAAAALTFWPELEVAAVDVARPEAYAETHEPYRFAHRTIPHPLICSPRPGLRLSAPALTALDLCTQQGPDAIDAVLRNRAATLTQLSDALAVTAGRRANPERTKMLLESRGNAWSALERRAHRLLRTAGVSGWVANHPVLVRSQGLMLTYYLDLAFRATRRVIELEGNRWHNDAVHANRDRYRHNDLTRSDWEIYRADWTMVDRDPDYVVELARFCAGSAPRNRLTQNSRRTTVPSAHLG